MRPFVSIQGGSLSPRVVFKHYSKDQKTRRKTLEGYRWGEQSMESEKRVSEGKQRDVREQAGIGNVLQLQRKERQIIRGEEACYEKTCLLMLNE